MATNAFEVFLGRKNARIVKLLEDNHDIANVFQAILEQTVEYCDHRGLSFKNLKIRDATLSHEGRISIQLLAE